eukprot:5731917-Pleurochrysis_carterae.AAC.1
MSSPLCFHSFVGTNVHGCLKTTKTYLSDSRSHYYIFMPATYPLSHRTTYPDSFDMPSPGTPFTPSRTRLTRCHSPTLPEAAQHENAQHSTQASASAATSAANAAANTANAPSASSFAAAAAAAAAERVRFNSRADELPFVFEEVGSRAWGLRVSTRIVEATLEATLVAVVAMRLMAFNSFSCGCTFSAGRVWETTRRRNRREGGGGHLKGIERGGSLKRGGSTAFVR